MSYAPTYWTVAEAIDYVRRHAGCAPAAARKLVCGVLIDAAIRGDLPSIIAWESLVEGLPHVFDPIPFDAEFWRKVRIRGPKVYDHHGNCWRTLWVLREVILLHWPQIGGADGSHSVSGSVRPARSPVSDSALRNWYAERVRGWLAGVKTPGEAQDVLDAKAEFPDHFVSRDRIRTLRASMAPDEWKRPARKSRG